MQNILQVIPNKNTPIKFHQIQGGQLWRAVNLFAKEAEIANLEEANILNFYGN